MRRLGCADTYLDEWLFSAHKTADEAQCVDVRLESLQPQPPTMPHISANLRMKTPTHPSLSFDADNRGSRHRVAGGGPRNEQKGPSDERNV